MGTGSNPINSYTVGTIRAEDLAGCFAISDELARTSALVGKNNSPSNQKFWKELTLFPKVKRVIYNDPATIVLWEDGTKSVVMCMDGQPFDEYAGFCSAVVKKVFGSTSKAKKIAGLKEKPVKVKIEEPVVDIISQYGGSISCTNIEGLSCGDYDQSVTDGQSHQDNGVTLTAE